MCVPEDLTNPSDPADSVPPAFPVVGIGASVGGLNALLGLFEQMPADSGMSFLVVLHVPPKDDDSAVGILARRTAMPVVQLKGRTILAQNHVYLVPGGYDLAMDGTSASPLPPSVQSGQHTSIDRFFRLLADTLHARAVGVVLSGSGSDGAVGLARIRELGGVALAQTPDEADHSSMPSACIASGAIDFVLPVAAIPAQLIRLWHNARQIQLPPLDDDPASEMPGSASSDDSGDASDADGGQAEKVGFPGVLDEAAEHALAQIMETLRMRTRHDFRHYKRATVLRRIGRRMQIIGSQDLDAYQAYLQGHAEETTALLQDMLISVTCFFRDPPAMESLDRNVLAGLLANRETDDTLRVWVVGCATGEEAYSVSILLHERISADDRAPGAGNPAIQVFATDIDDRALAIARNGLYPG
ncbi:MAG: chemotaxis protein CheB, partial [Lautropia sp.]